METRFVIFAGIVAVVVIVLAVSWVGWTGITCRASNVYVVGRGMPCSASSSSSSHRSNMSSSPRTSSRRTRKTMTASAGTGEAIRSDLAEALSRTPVDPEEIRRHLSTAARLGLDWKTLFDDVVNDELRERPFRTPLDPTAEARRTEGVSDRSACISAARRIGLATELYPRTRRERPG